MSHVKTEDIEATQVASITPSQALRDAGWAVAVHNDYRLNGVSHTFWLWTRGDYAIKGEGLTDAEALTVCLSEAKRLDASVVGVKTVQQEIDTRVGLDVNGALVSFPISDDDYE